VFTLKSHRVTPPNSIQCPVDLLHTVATCKTGCRSCRSVQRNIRHAYAVFAAEEVSSSAAETAL